MRKRRRDTRYVEEEENFWPAFTDMIATVVLILFFLVLVFYMEKIASGNAITSIEERFEELRIKFDQKEDALTDTENNLTLSQLEIEAKLLELQVLESDLEAGEDQLKLAKEAIEDQKQIIEDSNNELADLRAKLEGVALLRVDVLDKVKKSIEEELGEYNSNGEPIVSIGDNGNIIINENLVFDLDSSEVKAEGKLLLDSLAIAFENVLNDEDIRANIDAIAIQGHTDSRSSHQYNRVLSAERAYNVVNYLMEVNGVLANQYGEYFTASAYSEFRLIDNGTSEEAHARNRRIEIAVILKDSHIQNVINEYLNDSLKDFE